MRVEHGDGWELRLGSAFDLEEGLEALGDGEVDAVVTDPPYSKRTHAGHDQVERLSADGSKRSGLGYAYLTDPSVAFLAYEFDRIATGWVLAMCDHVLAPHWEVYLARAGRYVFAPLPYFAPGSRCRLQGDGPSSWTVWLVVGRTAELVKWGTLPGGYARKPGWDRPVYPGGKPLALMRAIVRDYTRAGDRVCDPFAGSGTTGVAALREGRSFLGWETDPVAFDLACRRLRGAAAQNKHA